MVDVTAGLATVRVRLDALLAGPLSGRVAGPAPIAVAELQHALDELEAEHLERLQQLEDLGRLEARTRAERLRYADLFHVAPQPYLVTDRAGVIALANDRAGDLLGSPPAWLVGRVLADLADPADRARVEAALAAPILGGPRDVRFALVPPANARPSRPPAATEAPIPVRATLSVARDLHGDATVRWLLHAALGDRDGLRLSAAQLHELATDVAALGAALGSAGAAVLLRDHGGLAPSVAASDDRALALARAQVRAGAGPAMDAAEAGRAVVEPRVRDRAGAWAAFAETAAAAGITAAASFPVWRGDDLAGVLDLYAEQALGDAEVVAAGHTLAAVVSACLTEADPARPGHDLVGQLEQALLARG